MTAPIHFSIADAQDALARSDEGEKVLPGDAELIAAYEGFCQQEQDRREYAYYEAERAAWLATQCPGCEDGGTGEPCDDHFGPEDACIACNDGTGTVVCGNCAEVPA
jgi:hypothetical protein